MPSPSSVLVVILGVALALCLEGYNAVLSRSWYFVVSFCISTGHNADVFYSLLQSKEITKFCVVVDKIVFKIASFLPLVRNRIYR
jgi:hypothetical protein